MKEMLRSWLGRFRAYWKLAVVGFVLAAAAGTAALAYGVGIFAMERHRGFFAPVWSEDGTTVYFVERETRGVVWGLGWEFFSPPANTYVISDRISIWRMDKGGDAREKLASFRDSPVEGRITQHYRGRIFNTMAALLTPGASGLTFRIRMDIPMVPRSEQWSLNGLWRPDLQTVARWRRKWAGNMGAGEQVLKNGIELIAIKGVESYPTAILAVDAEFNYRVLVKNGKFERLYPDGVPRPLIAEVSRRKDIERIRTLRRVKAELMAKYKAEGMNENDAFLKAYDEMERLGYYPKSPRLVATLMDRAPEGIRVFEIPAQRFEVGLYRDIANAIAQPGAEVKTDTGSYLRYLDDNTGPELRAWRQSGHDRFAVQSGGKLYLLQVHRFKN